ncbi:MAG: GntR family transcriptional regulator [Actinomycetota bacterium]|nr:GntR family transcriptional regulator [Actinomycetota bacterium]
MIATRVREAISAGDFPPGSQLYEAELVGQLGISRGPLREGLQRLTQEGLLTSVRNRGLFVVELAPQNVHEMYLAREAIERCAAAAVVRTGPAAAARALQKVVTEMVAGARAQGHRSGRGGRGRRPRGRAAGAAHGRRRRRASRAGRAERAQCGASRAAGAGASRAAVSASRAGVSASRGGR